MILALLALALADEVRIGVFVGNDMGGPGQQRLLFATSDARKMRDAFVEVGGIAPHDAILLVDKGQGDVVSALRDARTRLAAAESRGAETLLVFYYSGHGDEEGLRMGLSTLRHADLRHLLDESGADARVALLDACQSGGAVRSKGGVRGPSQDLAVTVATTRGTAILTSSSASEFSQESEELGGGFFTHFLHSALLGAADRDADRVVSLTEAYAWVHGQTAFRTRTTPEVQTPSYDFDLTGSGDLVLTRLDRATAALVFAPGLEGRYAVWDDTRRRYVAEVDGSTGARLALPPGEYHVQRRSLGLTDEASYHLRDRAVTVDEIDFIALAVEDTAARGALKRQARRARLPRLVVQATVGGRGWSQESVQGSRYLPTHAVAGVTARWLPPRQGVYWAADVLAGGGTGTIAFTELEPQKVSVQSWSLAPSVGFVTGEAYLVRAGVGFHPELISFGRHFLDADLPRQRVTTVAPGAQVWAGVHAGRFAADLGFAWHWLPVQFDDTPAGLYGELSLSIGGRF